VWRLLVTEPHATPAPRRTRAVTIAGALFLVWGVVWVLPAAVFVIDNAFPDSLALRHRPINLVVAVSSLVLALVVGYAGLAMMLRWRRWRIWAGTVSWGLIVIIVLGQFEPPSAASSLERSISLIVLVVVVFALVAKRREPRADIAAVFR
jgi:hypothetical protein